MLGNVPSRKCELSFLFSSWAQSAFMRCIGEGGRNAGLRVLSSEWWLWIQPSIFSPRLNMPHSIQDIWSSIWSHGLALSRLRFAQIGSGHYG